MLLKIPVESPKNEKIFAFRAHTTHREVRKLDYIEREEYTKGVVKEITYDPDTALHWLRSSSVSRVDINTDQCFIDAEGMYTDQHISVAERLKIVGNVL
jgi:ribosomal protein L2